MSRPSRLRLAGSSPRWKRLRKAEIRHQEWLTLEERRRREEDRNRVEQSIADSKAALAQLIARWANTVSVERFPSGIEERAEGIGKMERQHVLERLALARAFLGSPDPLDFFRDWKTPDERYASRYSESGLIEAS